MTRTIGAVLLLLLAGCASVPPPANDRSPCAGNETSYECQVYRYQNAF